MSHSATILLIEDDPATRRLFGEAIADTNVGELLATTGELDEPRAFPTRRDEDFALPDLIFLDLELTSNDALAVLRELKAGRSAVQTVPVLVFSDADDQDAINQAYRAGANAVLPKPDDYENLLRMVAKIGEFWTEHVHLPSQ